MTKHIRKGLLELLLVIDLRCLNEKMQRRVFEFLDLLKAQCLESKFQPGTMEIIALADQERFDKAMAPHGWVCEDGCALSVAEDGDQGGTCEREEADIDFWFLVARSHKEELRKRVAVAREPATGSTDLISYRCRDFTFLFIFLPGDICICLLGEYFCIFKKEFWRRRTIVALFFTAARAFVHLMKVCSAAYSAWYCLMNRRRLIHDVLFRGCSKFRRICMHALSSAHVW